MATTFALFAGVLLPCWGAFPQFKRGLMKAGSLMFPNGRQSPASPPWGLCRERVTQKLSPQMNGAWCSHHSECFSDCCLMNLDYGGTFCAPKARRAMVCLPQTKGATNIICPCQLGLACVSKDLNCPRRCHLI